MLTFLTHLIVFFIGVGVGVLYSLPPTKIEIDTVNRRNRK